MSNGRIGLGVAGAVVAAGLAWWLLGGGADDAGGAPAAEAGGAPDAAPVAGVPAADAGAGEAAPAAGEGTDGVAAPAGATPGADAGALVGPFTLDEAGAAAAVSATAVRVGACRKLTAASVKGDLKVELLVKPTMEGAHGYVESVAVLDGDRKLLGACLTDALSSARFPAPAVADGARLPVTLPAP